MVNSAENISIAPGAMLSGTIARSCFSVHRRRRTAYILRPADLDSCELLQRKLGGQSANQVYRLDTDGRNALD
jgi:hypothetical protein